jgi:hypothetical protein
MNDVRKLFVFLLSAGLISAVVIFFPNSVFANHQENVLGVGSEEALSIPPTVEGPGFILPDSPLFFLDQIKQQFRLLLAFTPEQKARVHSAIAGERMAELRLMLTKNNEYAIRTALQGLSDNIKAIANDLNNAKLTGRNIDVLAKSTNDLIKEKQSVLVNLETQATGETKALVKATREALKIAKVRVEENLPADLMRNEAIDDLNQQVDDSINTASLSAAELNRAMNALGEISSNAAAVRNESELTNLTNQFQNAQAKMQKSSPVSTNSKSARK